MYLYLGDFPASKKIDEIMIQSRDIILKISTQKHRIKYRFYSYLLVYYVARDIETLT